MPARMSATASIDSTRRRAEPTRSTVPGRREVDRDLRALDVARRHDALHSALLRLLLDLRGRVQGHLLVAQLVLLGDELALLVLEAGDVIRGLRDLRGDREIEEDDDHERADRHVGMTKDVQPQPLGRDRARHLYESTRAPSPPGWGGDVLCAGRAQAPAGQYSRRCHVNLFVTGSALSPQGSGVWGEGVGIDAGVVAPCGRRG